jgi:prophage DNA circulation protein
LFKALIGALHSGISKIHTIFEGTSEIQQLVIARKNLFQLGKRSSALLTKNASIAASPSGVMSAAMRPIGSVPPSGCGKSVEKA